MNFTLSSTDLSSRLGDMAKVINSKNTLAILNDFLFEINNGQLTITASDSENTITSAMPLASSDGDGRFCVDNSTMINSIKDLADQPLRIDVDMQTLSIDISYQNGHFSFVGHSADQYPTFNAIEDDAATISLSADVMSNNINMTLFATANDEIRPTMNGIYFDLTNDCLAVVATDGHKLVRCRDYSIKSEVPSSFILPKKPASLLKNILGKEDGEVIIKYNDRNAEITFDNGTLTCRLVEGRYPNYNSVIPTDNPNQLTADRQAFLAATKRVLVGASQNNSLVRFHVENGLLKLQSEDTDNAKSAEESLTCDYTGSTMSIGFRGTTVVEILSVLNSEQVILEFADPSRPGLIIPAQQDENKEVTMLMMPMLLNE